MKKTLSIFLFDILNQIILKRMTGDVPAGTLLNPPSPPYQGETARIVSVGSRSIGSRSICGILVLLLGLSACVDSQTGSDRQPREPKSPVISPESTPPTVSTPPTPPVVKPKSITSPKKPVLPLVTEQDIVLGSTVQPKFDRPFFDRDPRLSFEGIPASAGMTDEVEMTGKAGITGDVPAGTLPNPPPPPYQGGTEVAGEVPVKDIEKPQGLLPLEPVLSVDIDPLLDMIPPSEPVLSVNPVPLLDTVPPLEPVLPTKERTGDVPAGTLPNPHSPSYQGGTEMTGDEPAKPVAGESLICSFPEDLKKAVEAKTQKECSSITLKELSEIKTLKIPISPLNSKRVRVKLFHPTFTSFNPALYRSARSDYGAYFPSLESIDMSENPQMQALPYFLFSFQNLKELNISNTSVSDLGPQIAQLNKLESLNISNTNVSDLGPQIAQLNKLESLNISNTNVSDLGPQIAQLNKLESLNISHTKIQNLGPELCQLKNLHTLKASHNTYEGHEMPIAIVCLSELKTLDLSYSSLQYIDEYIWYLKKLENLNLRGNKLMSAPMLFGLMSSLVTLDLRDNLFEYPSVNTLSDCSLTPENSEEREDCQEELLEKVKCEYWYELPEDCSHIEEDELEQKEKCEKAKFKRGELGNQSFIKRYEEMTGEKHAERHEGDEGHLRARCYYWWINLYVFFGNIDDPAQDPQFLETGVANQQVANPQTQHHAVDLPISGTGSLNQTKLEEHIIPVIDINQKRQYLLDLTINGKTLRELRLAMDELTKAPTQWGCQLHLKGTVSFRDTQEVIREDWIWRKLPLIAVRLLYHGVSDFFDSLYHFFIWAQDTTYGPSHHETHPERHRAPDWNDRPDKNKTELCNPIDFNTPIPQGPLGPWSKALPAVQSLIEEKYLEPGWDECENWPTGQCYDWEERIKRGENPGGFKKEYFKKKIEEKAREREERVAMEAKRAN